MYKDLFGLNRGPFDLSPDPSFLWPSAKNREALASIMFAIANRKGIVVLTGEVGTGKTVTVRSLFELWKRK
jgi:general secretion pathway protein A